MTIGEKILRIRKDNKLSQEEFAGQLGVSRQAISKWELDESIPDIAKIALISRTFNVSTDSLIFETADLTGGAAVRHEMAEEGKFEKVVAIAAKTAKKHGYRIGYLLIGFGILNLFLSAALGILWNGFSKELTSFLLQYSLSLDLQFIFWIFVFMAMIAIITLIAGIIIVAKGRKINRSSGGEND